MPSAEQLRSRLLKKLSELFQLDQPDLDFGFYRIMHAKAQEVQDFIGTDLLKIVADAFGGVDEARKAELQAAYEKAIQTAKDFGAPNPEETEPVKKAKAALDAVKDTASAEADVYDHLYRFFERYYDDGDFISRRYYTRETPGKAAPFAVPYNGEEVKLHWANADQYYIKSAEYFSNFTFDLRQAQEIRALRQQNQIGILLGAEDDSPIKVHFRVVEATEGEHGNVKASEANKRFFILHAENPVALTETGELVVNFEYRPDPEKTGQENTWRDKRNSEAVETILERLQAMAAAGGKHEKQIAEYLRLFNVPAPTDSDKKRPVLAKYVNQYTARNTMDYFIHKDLGGFLHRELDFYIKNEVMRLDDIENAEAPAVESYLAKIKVLRKIAGKLIDFLAQLEDFQKKLWLKKKFIIETNYCITLDRVPEELYAEVAASDAQCEEWIKLFAIDEIQADLHNPGFSRPLRVEFLKANNKLVLDTRFFDDNFKARLVASIENLDEQCDGLLIHSENFQALNLLKERYREQVKCVYIDPPYNTANDEFPYKDGYQASSWFSMMLDRAHAASALMSREGLYFQQIGDDEAARSRLMLEEIFAERKNSVVARRGIKNVQAQFEDISRLSLGHDLIHIFSNKRGARIPHLHQLLENGKPGKWDTFWRGTDRPTMRYELLGQHPETGQWRWEKIRARKASQNYEHFLQNESDTKSLDEWYAENLQAGIDLDFVRKNDEETVQYYVPPQTFKLVSDNWLDIPSSGTVTDFPHEKSLALLQRIIGWITSPGELVLDYFAGSGSTGHAAIRFTNTKTRKYLLCEMGNYFDTVLKPRIAKTVYSESWKDGKPTACHTGISHCFKYIRLESYEDTLNNLRLDHNPQRKKAVATNPALKEDYMLRYLLDVETRGSQSLLNIDAFGDPTAYTLDVKKPGTDEYATRAVDLIETFNYLIGLRVLHTSVPQTFRAEFKRITDPELPEDQHTKLMVDGRIQQDEGGPWWFRKVEGWVPKDPANPNNGQREKVLVVWRKLTDDIEQDNLMLDEWFQKNRISTRDFEFDTIYVNGSNNLPNLKLDDEDWKVRLIEEEFMKRMWNGENA
ncbi:DNA methylase N-4/N-6 domain protein [Desulfovibrio sp. X2]|uniref:DNA methyltransferase n=1 Tax=Desulfovibrio sp. X2 TaxID=941449 RepID=UPI00035878E0|nr:site-specific DNA-methyltransferase [Desulfovibrio sp. X2]EPR44207.1 DNA methylase N-4/N-6 domain protein [Desulfovibrio sp. X2]